MSLAVIIPSKSASNVIRCIAAIRQNEPIAEIIVVDDGLPDRSVIDAITIDGSKPFNHSTNSNIGIRAAGEKDVVLLNDDALLETPGGFSIMQCAAELNPQIGIIGAVTDLTGQPLQRRPRNVQIEDAARQDPAHGIRALDHFAFVCVLLPFRTRQILADLTLREPHVFTGGLLDERYEKYGSNDLDMCMQVQHATLSVCVADSCFVNHSSLHSSYRGEPTAAGDIWANHRILRAKWGMPPNPADPAQRGAR